MQIEKQYCSAYSNAVPWARSCDECELNLPCLLTFERLCAGTVDEAQKKRYSGQPWKYVIMLSDRIMLVIFTTPFNNKKPEKLVCQELHCEEKWCLLRWFSKAKSDEEATKSQMNLEFHLPKLVKWICNILTILKFKHAQIATPVTQFLLFHAMNRLIDDTFPR